jgi:hypothetical protein
VADADAISGTLIFRSETETVVASAGDRRDARAAARDGTKPKVEVSVGPAPGRTDGGGPVH